MNIFKRSVWADLIASAIALVAAPAAMADNMRVRSDMVGSGLNMRSGPSTAYGVVTVLPPHARNINWTCRVARVGSSTWYEIDWHGYHGWASSRFLRYMRGSHRHCDTDQVVVNPRPSYDPGHHGITHTHRHSHGGHVHRHSHSHPYGANSHNHHGHSGGGHGASNYDVNGCLILHIGALRLRLCD